MKRAVFLINKMEYREMLLNGNPQFENFRNNELIEFGKMSKEIINQFKEKNKLILNETTNFCQQCSSRENCPENECVLYRIEKIIEGRK